MNDLVLPPPILVDTAETLNQMCACLMSTPIVGVDTESNSLYAYTERVCLVQFSTPEQDYLLDPLVVHDLSALAPFFADAGIEKVFHAAEYDVMVLRRDYGFTFASLFDTMIASRIVGWRDFGLGNLLEQHFGVVTNKRMQRTNWGSRPLTPDQLAYARLDTHFLISLRNLLFAEMAVRRRLAEGRAAFAQVAQSCWNGKEFDPDGFWHVKGARTLDDVGLAVLRALYIYRDQRARALDRPPFKVLSDSALVTLSEQRPHTLAELAQIKGLPRHWSDGNRHRLLAAIGQGSREQSPKRPPRESNGWLDQKVESRYAVLREWRKRRALERGVEPDVILSNRTLHELALHNPTSLDGLEAIEALSEWERQTYGDELVALLSLQTS